MPYKLSKVPKYRNPSLYSKKELLPGSKNTFLVQERIPFSATLVYTYFVAFIPLDSLWI